MQRNNIICQNVSFSNYKCDKKCFSIEKKTYNISLSGLYIHVNRRLNCCVR